MLKSFKIETRSPRTLPGSPGELREPPKSASEAPQERPRAPQERPRAPQERPRAPQEPLKSAQRRPREPSGTILRFRSSKKAAFQGDPSRDSVGKRVRNDFRSIFASCAQARTCEKPIKTYGFYRFFTGRFFFERVSQLERERIEKASKNLQNRPSEDPKSS